MRSRWVSRMRSATSQNNPQSTDRRGALLGLSFKAGPDDLRESPLVELVERLLGKGYELRIYDRNVSLASLVGANRDYIPNRIPHISNLMVESMDEVLAFGETLVIGNGAAEFQGVVERLRPGQGVVGPGRIAPPQASNPGRYEGICW